MDQRLLRGHHGSVNCLLCPHSEDERYSPQHLLSGGADFSVVLWDVAKLEKLYTFSTHGGEVLQLLVPPPNCNVSTAARVVHTERHVHLSA